MAPSIEGLERLIERGVKPGDVLVRKDGGFEEVVEGAHPPTNPKVRKITIFGPIYSPGEEVPLFADNYNGIVKWEDRTNIQPNENLHR